MFFFFCAGLVDQALIHASKGRDILLAPGSHVMSHDPIPEAVHCLSTAHCIIGRVLTERGRYGVHSLSVCVHVTICLPMKSSRS